MIFRIYWKYVTEKLEKFSAFPNFCENFSSFWDGVLKSCTLLTYLKVNTIYLFFHSYFLWSLQCLNFRTLLQGLKQNSIKFFKFRFVSFCFQLWFMKNYTFLFRMKSVFFSFCENLKDVCFAVCNYTSISFYVLN